MAKILNFITREKNPLEMRLRKIKEGDKLEREKLIEDYTPFIIKGITKVTNRYIETDNDDEYSIGLQAFNEAIDKYESERGSFLNFAQLLIRSRVIDFMRKAKSRGVMVSIDDENVNEGDLGCLAVTEDFTYSYEIKEQIVNLERNLMEFQISMKDLLETSPKHVDTRLNSIEIARYMIEDNEIKEELYRKKTIPVNKLIMKKNVSRKVLKRNRKFIIATALILDSNSQLLKNYITEVERRG